MRRNARGNISAGLDRQPPPSYLSVVDNCVRPVGVSLFLCTPPPLLPHGRIQKRRTRAELLPNHRRRPQRRGGKWRGGLGVEGD
jgi:hypothetical protein